MSSFSQLFGQFPYRGLTEEKVIALTFDDGPNEPYTSQIVNYLNKKGIKATFFMVGKNAQKHPNVVKKVHESGHTIGNHSMSHQFHKYITRPLYHTEFVDSQRILKKLIGKEPNLFRPPWLWRNPILFKGLKNQDLIAVSGEFCYIFEVFQPSAKKIAEHALSKVNHGSIIIFHDGYNAKGADRTQTVEAVKLVVNQLMSEGYRFVTVDELLNIPPYH